jgi:outer membrane receptor protein involved in Fe transport
LPSFSPIPSLSGQNYTTFTTRQAAIFGQMDYRITHAVRVQLGARGESIRNSGLEYQPCSTSASIPASQEQCPGRVAPPPAPPMPQPPTYSLTIDTHTHYTPVTGKGALQYFFSDNAMTYMSVAKGFRDGGINETQSDYDTRTNPPTLNPPSPNQPYVPPTYRPDTDTTYELGWKLSFPSVRGTLDGAVYHTVWRDMQVLAFANNAAASLTGLAPAWENAPAAAIDGFEMEGGLQLFPGLNLSGSLAVMKGIRHSFVAVAATRFRSLPVCRAACP